MNTAFEILGRWHPAMVHFPVALILAAGAAEILYAVRREQRFGEAARFMIAAAAWIGVPAAAAGFAAAAGEVFTEELAATLAVHRVAGVATPVLAFVAHGLCEGTRRSGQVWEQMLYRGFLLLAVAGVLVAAYYGGKLGHGL